MSERFLLAAMNRKWMGFFRDVVDQVNLVTYDCWKYVLTFDTRVPFLCRSSHLMSGSYDAGSRVKNKSGLPVGVPE